MLNKTKLAAVLAATTLLAGSAAFAADQAMQASSSQATLTKDAGKLSAQGIRAYNDVAMTRLAIFDGRVKDAKKLVDEADADLAKAKTDESVFMKAEADLHVPPMAKTREGKDDAAQAADSSKADSSKSAAAGEDSAKTAATTPKRWLPVDAEMMVNEDFTASPKKAAAVADANKSLAKGDKQGAMAKLKLADVDVDYIMAVVPLDQTLSDVHQAATLVNDGKYYEASQMLRQVQDSTRFDLLDISGTPGNKAVGGKTTGAEAAPAPTTH